MPGKELFPPIKRTWFPDCFFALGYDKRYVSRDDTLGFKEVRSTWTVIQRFAKCYGHYRKSSVAVTMPTSDLFTRFATIVGTTKRPTVLSYNVPLLLEVSDFRLAIEGGLWKVSAKGSAVPSVGLNRQSTDSSSILICSNPPNLVKLDPGNGGQSLILFDVVNYGIGTMDELLSLLESVEPVGAYVNDAGYFDYQSARAMADAVGAFWSQYTDTVRAHDLGSPRFTLGSQALESFRYGRSVLPVVCHDNQEVKVLERSAYLGGRTEVYAVGHYSHRCHYLDVNSMYPHVAMTKSLPCEFVELVKNPRLDQLNMALQDYFVIAEVYCEVDKPYLPKDDKQTLKFPTGRFNTVLCSPELTRAFTRGHILKCYRFASYRRADILSHYAFDMTSRRATAKKIGNRFADHVIKRVTNALWGKLGQEGSQWVHTPGLHAPGPFATWIESAGVGEYPYLCRSIGWRCERLYSGLEIEQTFVPISAAINSYGRSMIGSIMDVLGSEEVLYVATDGVIVTQRGLELAECMPGFGGGEPGQIRIQHSADCCTISGYGVFEMGELKKDMGVPIDGKEITLGFTSCDPRYRGSYEVEGEVCFAANVYHRHSLFAKTMEDLRRRPLARVQPERFDEGPQDTSLLFPRMSNSQ